MFKTKFYFSKIETEIKTLESNIILKQEELNLLEAELSYLTNPARIQVLCEKHLKHSTIRQKHIRNWRILSKMKIILCIKIAKLQRLF